MNRHSFWDTRVLPCCPLVRSAVRFLLVNNHCISDPTAGVTQSLRTIVEWLADAGHACHILTTARFESAVTFTIEEHLRQQGVDAAPRAAGSTIARSRRRSTRRALPVGDVPVTLLLTRHNDESRPDRAETSAVPRAASTSCSTISRPIS